MTTLTIAEFHDAIRAQGSPSRKDIAFLCPACGTVQSARDFIRAGAGDDFEAVEKHLAFSCIGRFTHANPPPKKKGKQKGCNWTLGGLLRIHELEIIDEQGKHHPRFALATPEQAKAHLEAS